jgi:hypothetical protein
VIVYFLALGAVYEAFVVAQGGHSPSFALLVGVVMATAVLSNIPISLNGLGLREQLHAALLARSASRRKRRWRSRFCCLATCSLRACSASCSGCRVT